MGIFSRLFRRRRTPGADAGHSKAAQEATERHFRDFVHGRQGCEAFIEPATPVTPTTMVVVADTGEWTRRKVPDPVAGRKLASALSIPAFDVNLSGYPSRMREWNEKQRKHHG